MESPRPDEKKPGTSQVQVPPLPEERSGAQISLVRKIVLGLFIVGYWVLSLIHISEPTRPY